MIKNYFLIAWRNLLKHKVSTLINLLGLTVAFTTCLLLALSVYHEFSYDKFHVNGKDIYRPYFSTQNVTGKEVQVAMPGPMLNALKAFPAVKYGSRYNVHAGELEYNGKHFMREITYVDKDFFSMFSFPLIRGRAAAVLNDPNNIVLDEELAQAVFGEEDPMGKQVKMQAGDSWRLYTVSGIVQNEPDNSSLPYKVFTLFENDINNARNTDNWFHSNHDLFIQLLPGTDPGKFEAGVRKMIRENYYKRIDEIKRDGVKPSATGQYVELLLQPFLKIHTDTSIRSYGNVISPTYLKILLAVAVVVLLIACINFINLTIGRSFTRCLEVGMRKTLGARPQQLVIQFWAEAALTCLMALLISVPLFFLLLPHYKEIFEGSLNSSLIRQPRMVLSIIGCFLLITIVAGGYPAWIMARLKAVSILKGKLRLKTSGPVRSGLIISQFAIAILFISCTVIAWKQLNYLRSKPLGYNSSEVISIPVGCEVNGKDALELMRQRLAGESFVMSITGLSDNFGQGLGGGDCNWGITFDHKGRSLTMRWWNVGYDFVKTMNLTLLKGRDFSATLPGGNEGIVINEQMALEMGEKDPVGTQLEYDPMQPSLTVIGVVKDFNFRSLRSKVKPLGMVMYTPMPINYLMVKVRPDNLPDAMDKLSAAWASIAPKTLFKGSFINDNINRQYYKEERLTRIFVYAAVIAITLSCLGLLALAILVIMQRSKEIGIRKVMGASSQSIVQLIMHDFIKLIVIAMVIAAPIAYYLMNIWLKGFAFSIEIKWWWLPCAGLLALLVALCTIGYQSMKAAYKNPIKSLRSE